MNKKELINELFKKFETIYRPIYFRDMNGNFCITIIDNNQTNTFYIDSSFSKSFINFFLISNEIYSESFLDNLISRIKIEVYKSNIVKETFIRVGLDSSKNIVVDLVNNGFCEINTNGLKIVNITNAPLIRTQKMNNLPLPIFPFIDSDFMKKFKSLFNLENENDIYLILTFIIKSLIPNSGANPILIFLGQQGSAKTTATKHVANLIDPRTPLIFSPPNNEQDLFVVANANHLLAFDNMSGLNSQLADDFCRISTGGGISKRELYSDSNEKTYSFSRPVIFNGIDELTTRPDFLDRAIIIHLAKIPQEKRVSETEIKQSFENNFQNIFSTILNFIPDILKEYPNVQKTNLPRMTEFVRIGIALEKCLNLPKGEFLRVFNQNSSDKNDTAFDNDEVCMRIYKILTSFKSANRNEIRGTTSEIYDMLRTNHGRNPIIHFPNSIKGFAGKLKRIEPLLNSRGITITHLPRTANRREIVISLLT